ncbi:Ribosomal protein S1 [Macleaya cordata]|uniref:Ribosomal protein S1 n=1 Tax=Macleaya cordata TaxID=56857 RepID=A0A200QDX1_MACCD|nr:Ribosomal protein S1 [Macleaya cordata]
MLSASSSSSPVGSITGLSFLSQIFSNNDASCNSPSIFASIKYPSVSSTYFRKYSSSSSLHRPFPCTLKVSVSGGTELTKPIIEKGREGEKVTPQEDSPPNSNSTDELRQARRSADWKAARAYKESGAIYEGRVEGFNGGGLLVRFYSVLGFLPYPLLSPSHACKEPQKSMQEIAKDLVGSLISVKVVEASEENRRMIFSEKEAIWSKFSGQVKVGDIFEARVGSVEDYGAFVHLLFPDGYYHITGLVHVSEVSWDLVQDVRDILNEGDNVRAKVIQIDRKRLRVTLSIKQLEEDPLLETLDKVIPQDGQAGFDSSTTPDLNIEPLPGLDSIFKELLQEDGITDVRISRQGFEKRVVSPDLQLWLSNAPAVDNQFTLLARAGRQVQEVHLTTTLDQDGIKKALQRVLERVP